MSKLPFRSPWPLRRLLSDATKKSSPSAKSAIMAHLAPSSTTSSMRIPRDLPITVAPNSSRRSSRIAMPSSMPSIRRRQNPSSKTSIKSSSTSSRSTKTCSTLGHCAKSPSSPPNSLTTAMPSLASIGSPNPLDSSCIQRKQIHSLELSATTRSPRSPISCSSCFSPIPAAQTIRETPPISFSKNSL